MSENGNQQCSTCSENCDQRDKKKSFLVETNELSNVKKVIGIVSGKGGVGKSLVTSLLAAGMCKRGYHTAILDADITGPSIPKAFGIKEKALGVNNRLLPVKSNMGIDIMSLNLIVENETDPAIWRGPIIADIVRQFWAEVIWEDVDYMFVDMPPGTGDVPLTVFQSLPLSGIVVVTSPQELVSMIVEKAVNMAGMMNVPVIGLVENMSYFQCPDCDKKYSIFGESKIEEMAQKHNVEAIAKIPIEPSLAQACDSGKIETVEEKFLELLLNKIEKL